MDTLRIANLGLDRDVLEYLESRLGKNASFTLARNYLEDMMTEYSLNIMVPEPDEMVIQLIKDHYTLSTYYSQLIQKFEENENDHSKNRKRSTELSV
jgi:hypothetical protein